MTKLIVEFSGLCYFLRHKDGKRIGVLMPDGRSPLTTVFPDANAPKGPEGKDPSAHVGYIRFDLADVLAGADLDRSKPYTRVQSSSGKPDPKNEYVHRFDRDLLTIVGLTDDAMNVSAFEIPLFECFAPDVELKPDVFSTTPPPELLMRTIISGGSFDAPKGKFHWDFVDAFGEIGMTCGGDFTNRVTWTREIPGPNALLEVKLTSFDGTTEKAMIRLRPAVDDTIKIKVANLCSDNPIEWRDFGNTKPFRGRRDEDFKWFYTLMQPKSGTWQDLLKGTRMPVPTLERRTTGGPMGNPPGCTPGGGDDGGSLF